MFEIVKVPDPILKKKLPFFEEKDFLEKEKINKLIEEMKETMIKNEGIGLAANQINYPKAVFVATWKKKFYAFFNPEIIKASEQQVLSEEGCLSIPGVIALVPRAKNITIKAKNKEGKDVKLKVFGMLAIIFQHEIDHLNGILITDKAKETRKIK